MSRPMSRHSAPIVAAILAEPEIGPAMLARRFGVSKNVVVGIRYRLRKTGAGVQKLPPGKSPGRHRLPENPVNAPRLSTLL